MKLSSAAFGAAALAVLAAIACVFFVCDNETAEQEPLAVPLPSSVPSPAIAAISSTPSVNEQNVDFAVAEIPIEVGLDDSSESAQLDRLQQWADTDPEGALAWIENAQENPFYYSLLTSLGRQIARQDPKRALGLATRFPEGNLRQTFVAQVVQVWAKNSMEDAVKWAAGVADEDLRSVAQNVIAIEWAQYHPSAAADYVATSMAGSAAQNQVAITIALRWAHLDATAAAAWARSFPAGSLKDDVLRAVNSVAQK